MTTTRINVERFCIESRRPSKKFFWGSKKAAQSQNELALKVAKDLDSKVIKLLTEAAG